MIVISKIILYSTGCPKCKVLAAKLEAKHIDYALFDDVPAMIKMGMMSAPNLGVDGKIMNFTDAIAWLNEQ